jgi:hypothetical protein
MGANKDKEMSHAEAQRTQERMKSCLCALCASVRSKKREAKNSGLEKRSNLVISKKLYHIIQKFIR